LESSWKLNPLDGRFISPFKTKFKGRRRFSCKAIIEKKFKKRLIYHPGFIKLFETLSLSIKSVRNPLLVDHLKEALWPN
jgi:hypothetical protein